MNSRSSDLHHAPATTKKYISLKTAFVCAARTKATTHKAACARTRHSEGPGLGTARRRTGCRSRHQESCKQARHLRTSPAQKTPRIEQMRLLFQQRKHLQKRAGGRTGVPSVSKCCCNSRAFSGTSAPLLRTKYRDWTPKKCSRQYPTCPRGTRTCTRGERCASDVARTLVAANT